MSPFVQTVNFILPFLTVIGDAFILFYFFAILLRWRLLGSITFLISKNFLLLSFFVALTATSGSLFYSEIAGFEPCKLCWIQRIFMYPQVILLGTALKRKDSKIAIYILPLSLIGAVFSAYHYYLQVGGAPIYSCTTIGYSASCSERFVLQFGYITIPMMALTAFLLIIIFIISFQRDSLRSVTSKR